jgi:hypothetical protein
MPHIWATRPCEVAVFLSYFRWFLVFLKCRYPLNFMAFSWLMWLRISWTHHLFMAIWRPRLQKSSKWPLELWVGLGRCGGEANMGKIPQKYGIDRVFFGIYRGKTLRWDRAFLAIPSLGYTAHPNWRSIQLSTGDFWKLTPQQRLGLHLGQFLEAPPSGFEKRFRSWGVEEISQCFSSARGLVKKKPNDSGTFQTF